MKYALLLYGSRTAVEDAPEPERELDPGIAAVLAQPSVADWVRLHSIASATTVRRQDGKRLLTDGPFLDSKEYIGGLVIVDAADLDGALAIAEELQEQRPNVVIEVRPVLETA
ncbi:MAG TPA: YciI family protein [Solirubrobacteraceae bacterium]|nr:YciI family protein [Solirubrobacteraceae bacterium]